MNSTNCGVCGLETSADLTHECPPGFQHSYRTIVADPPWPFQWSAGKGGRRRRETELGYTTMSVDEICALDVRALAHPEGCHLFLWVTDEMLAEGAGMKVARSWGFERSGPSIVWRKPQFGLGVFPRPQHEQILVCRLRGSRALWKEGANRYGSVFDWNLTYGKNNGGRQHSAKPEGFLDLIECVLPGPYLELFARRNRIGWDTWGDQAISHVDVRSAS